MLNDALLSAIARGDQAHLARLRDLIATLPDAESELSHAWSRALAGAEPAAVGRLAAALDRHSAADPELREALDRWLLRPATDPPAQENVLSGSAQIWGPALQAGQVHGNIHLHGVAPPPRPVPRQLPPVSPHFVDRTEYLAALDRSRARHRGPAPQLVVLSGPAGVGKSALATRWIGGLADEYPDGLLYADLGGYGATDPVPPGQVLEGFLRAVGAPGIPPRMTEMVALWRSLTAVSRLAVLLDNALTAAQVRPLLPSAADSLVVVTSRRQLSGLVVDGAELHQLDVLDLHNAVELLDKVSGGSRVAKDPEGARQLVQVCALLPLAVCLAAAQLAAHPWQKVSAMADTLSEGEGPVERLRVEGEAAIRKALDESYRTLDQPLRRVYRRLGLLPVAEFDVPLAAAACGIGQDAARDALSALAEVNLLEEHREKYRFHDLVGQHARLRAREKEPPAAVEETLRRFVDWCLAGASAAEALLSFRHQDLTRDYVHEPGTPFAFDGEEAALRWLEEHLQICMAAVRYCSKAGWHTACWQLVDALWPAFLRLRPAELWVEAHEIGLAAARRDGNRKAIGRMLTSGGNGLRNLGRLEEAARWYTRALHQAEEDGDLRQRAQALHSLGNVRLAMESWEEAERYFRQALVLREEVGHHRGAALSRLCLGRISLERGDHRTAVNRLHRAHRELLEAGDTYDAMRALAFLGLATALGGDLPGGRGILQEALGGMVAAGSRQWQATVMEMLGRAAQHAGAAEEAREWYERSAAVYREIRPDEARRVEERLRAL